MPTATKIVLASNNQGKLREFQQLLAQTSFTVIAQSEFDIESAAETGHSFVENAILKARHACQLANLPSIADDSGLVVDALRGAPGIYSARYSGVEGDDEANNVLLLKNLEGVTESERSARFHCALAFMQHQHDPTPIVCQASWEGMILTSARGTNGFGYDPLFYVPNQHCTSAELPPQIKNQLSHRAQAMQKLLAAFKETHRLV
jgi:XTP/dITP diphosphohydrolase